MAELFVRQASGDGRAEMGLNFCVPIVGILRASVKAELLNCDRKTTVPDRKVTLFDCGLRISDQGQCGLLTNCELGDLLRIADWPQLGRSSANYGDAAIRAEFGVGFGAGAAVFADRGVAGAHHR